MTFLREKIGSWTTSNEDTVTAACRSAIRGSDILTVSTPESFCINSDRYVPIVKEDELGRVKEMMKHTVLEDNTEMPGVVFSSVFHAVSDHAYTPCDTSLLRAEHVMSGLTARIAMVSRQRNDVSPQQRGKGTAVHVIAEH